VTVVEGKREGPLPKEVYEVVERMDEDQILAEMKGELVRSYVYSFEVQGRKVTGLTYAGVRQAIRGRGHAVIVPCQCCGKAAHVDEDERLYKAQVRMRDLVNDVEVVGASTSAKDLLFAYTLAINKAERNAIRKIIPEKVVVQLIEEFLRRAQPSTPVPEQKLTPEMIDEKLAQVGLDPTALVYELGETKYIIRSKSYLGTDNWRHYSDELKTLGFTWISAGKDSRWERPR